MRAALAVVVCAGCSQIFGLDDPARAGAVDSAVEDSGDDVGVDGAPPGARVRRIDIDAAKIVGGPHASFPVLVEISASWLRSTALGGGVANPMGHDLYFSLDQAGTVELAHEVERYGVDGLFRAWVKLPALGNGNGESFYLHYGDPSIDAKENAKGVWSNNYMLVMHMGSAVDSLEASTASAVVGTVTETGVIGDAIRFDGATSNINMGATVDGTFDGGGTVEAWVRPTSYGESNWGRVVDKGDPNGWLLYLNDNNANDCFSFANGSNNATFGQWTSSAGSVPLNTWTHIAAVFDRNDGGNVPILYVNGQLTGVTQHSAPSGAFDNDVGKDVFIGNSFLGDRGYMGRIDEVRLSAAVRSAGWFATQHANQSSPSTFYTISNEL